MIYDYPSGFKNWGSEEAAAIQRVIVSDWFTYGPETEAFEIEIAALHDRRYAIAVNSGSSANWVALAALYHRSPIRQRWTAVVPSIAWATTWAPPIDRGMRLFVSDVDDTWNAPARISPTVDVLITCPVLGNSAHIASAYDEACKARVLVLEDGCESLGAVSADGRRVGTFGDVSTLSFYMSHQIAGIEGGVVLTDDPELYRLCRQLRNHGWTRDTDSPVNFEDEYNFVLPGMNLRPAEINMAVCREQLRKLPAMVHERRLNADYFRELTADLPIVHPRIEGQPSPFGLAFTVQSLEDRRRLVAALRANSIDCRLPTGGSFTRHKYGAPWREANPTPNADRVHDYGLFLGCAPYPIHELIERAVKVMRETL